MNWDLGMEKYPGTEISPKLKASNSMFKFVFPTSLFSMGLLFHILEGIKQTHRCKDSCSVRNSTRKTIVKARVALDLFPVRAYISAEGIYSFESIEQI